MTLLIINSFASLSQSTTSLLVHLASSNVYPSSGVILTTASSPLLTLNSFSEVTLALVTSTLTVLYVVTKYKLQVASAVFE